jgi:hypothetical protein
MPARRDRSGESTAGALLEQLEQPLMRKTAARRILRRLQSLWHAVLPLVLPRAASPHRRVRRSRRTVLLKLVSEEDIPALRRALEDPHVPDLGKIEWMRHEIVDRPAASGDPRALRLLREMVFFGIAAAAGYSAAALP